MIVFAFPMPVESVPFRRSLAHAPREEVAVWHLGVGPGVAGQRAEEMLTRSAPQPELFVLAGFAGGLDPSLRRGDVVADPRSTWEIPELAGRQPFHTAREVAGTAAEKTRLHEATGCGAVEMESAAVARVCEERAIPLVSLRVILDPADEDLPAPPGLLFDLRTQRTPILRLAAWLALHPGRIPGVIHLGRRAALAAETLSAACERVLSGFLVQRNAGACCDEGMLTRLR